MTLEQIGSQAETHHDAELRQVVVRGFVRDDPEWKPAIEDALRTLFAEAAKPTTDLQLCAQAIDAAMMRAIFAAHRTQAVRDLGTVSFDATDPLERERWQREGAPAAAERAEAFNRETAALTAAEEG